MELCFALDSMLLMYC